MKNENGPTLWLAFVYFKKDSLVKNRVGAGAASKFLPSHINMMRLRNIGIICHLAPAL
jgi:hypothetical protein